VGGIPTELTDEQVARLETYEDLLRTHAIPFGFVAASDAGNLRERHLNDSLRGAALVRATDRVGIDLGSGAGLPGIVIAIACPDLEVTLAESRRTRVAFLEMVVETLGLSKVAVHAGRVENLLASADLCFARAFKSPSMSWKEAERLLNDRGRLVYWAGASFELRDAPDGVRCEAFPSVALARSGPLVMMCRQ
jgi:16S rRNA (guanine527-N7)-methyltransferase